MDNKPEGGIMEKISIGRMLVSAPFFILGAAFLAGLLWMVVGRLLEGLEWKDGDGMIIGWLVVMAILGGAFLQFGKDALYKGSTREPKALIGPATFYVLGAFFIVPGAWQAFYNPLNGVIILAVGIAFSIYGATVVRARVARRREAPPA